ncbi:YjgP/YjgQ family permease [bacterium]|jgi:lipopolysaccharide export system permease protein|nr:YjgP/YjgQ family permease [bacterium]
MIKKFDAYIAKEIIYPFIFGMIAFTLILIGSSVLFPLVEDAIKYQIPLPTVIKLLVFQTPAIVVFTFPMATLLGTLIGFGRLSSDGEITAFRSAGIGIYRIVAPVIIVGLLISFATILFNEYVVPTSNYKAKSLLKQLQNKNQVIVKNNINITEYDKQGLPLRILNVMNAEDGLLKDITVAEFEKGWLSRIIRANTGKWFATGGWVFYDGIMHNFSHEAKTKVNMIKFKKEYINIKLNPSQLTGRKKSTKEMNGIELWEAIQIMKSTGASYTKDLVKFHLKFSVPFASLIFSILGAGVGIRPHRSSSAIGLGLSLLIIIIYYILLSLGMGLGESEKVPAVIAAWIPNLIVGLFGFGLLKKVAS